MVVEEEAAVAALAGVALHHLHQDLATVVIVPVTAAVQKPAQPRVPKAIAAQPQAQKVIILQVPQVIIPRAVPTPQ